MLALSAWPALARRSIAGVFTDIDDTLTTHGVITADARKALADLKAAGLCVVGITGRPIGWCAQLLMPAQGEALPLDALVAENGAVAWVKNTNPPNSPHSHHKQYQQDTATRHHNYQRMHAVAQDIMHALPGVKLSQDSGGRETDIAFDHREYAQLPPDIIAQVVAMLQAADMHTSVSSIHIHGCYGAFDKWLGAQWIVQTQWGRSLVAELDQWVFVGDSGNDQAMFQHFTHSVGVANIRQCESQLTHLPRYIAPSERGAGFAEVADALLKTHPHAPARTRSHPLEPSQTSHQ